MSQYQELLIHETSFCNSIAELEKQLNEVREKISQEREAIERFFLKSKNYFPEIVSKVIYFRKIDKDFYFRLCDHPEITYCFEMYHDSWSGTKYHLHNLEKTEFGFQRNCIAEEMSIVSELDENWDYDNKRPTEWLHEKIVSSPLCLAISYLILIDYGW